MTGWAYTALDRGGDTLEVPAACDRHRNRSVAGDGKVNHEAHRRKIKFQILPTAKAIKTLEKHPERTNAIPSSDMLARQLAEARGNKLLMSVSIMMRTTGLSRILFVGLHLNVD